MTAKRRELAAHVLDVERYTHEGLLRGAASERVEAAGTAVVLKPVGLVDVLARDHLNGKQLAVADEVAACELALEDEAERVALLEGADGIVGALPDDLELFGDVGGNAQGLDGGSEARGGDAGDAFLERVEGDGVFGGGEELARAGDLDAAAVLRVRALEIEVQEGKSAVGQNACVDVLAVLRHDERTQHALRADVGDGLRVDDFKACEQGGEGLAVAYGQAAGRNGAVAAQGVERLRENGVVNGARHEVRAVLFLRETGRDAEHGARCSDHDHRGYPRRCGPGTQSARVEKRGRGPDLEPGSKRPPGGAELPGNEGGSGHDESELRKARKKGTILRLPF